MSTQNNNSDVIKRFAIKGVFPYQMAFTLLIPLRNIFLSPKQLIKRLGLKPDMRVMELGPGPGYFSKQVAKELKDGALVLADIQQEMLDYARKRMDKKHFSNVEYYLCDGKSFDFGDNTFDRIFMVTVLGEVENKDDYIKELRRILKDGGILSITELAGDPDKMKPEDISSLLKEYNFSFYTLFGNKKNFTINFKK